MTIYDISPLIKYNSINDISYIEYNSPGIPFMFDTTYIYHSNEDYNDGSYSQYLRTISNNLVIESNDSNIILSVPDNKKVIVKNNMTVNNNLDVCNSVTTNRLTTNDISMTGVLYLNPDLSTNIIGDLRILGNLTFANNTGVVKKTFTALDSKIFRSIITDSDICNSIIYSCDLSHVTITNSYIYNSVIGYDNNNNIVPNKAIFTDVSLNNLILNSNSQGTPSIKFNSDSNSIIIQNSNDHSKLEISTPLIVGPQSINTNISNISIFNGDVSCNTLYYKHLNPDIRLNNFSDISISNISISGNIIPTTNNFNIGASDHKFNNIYSSNFIGSLIGSSKLALDLKKNLDMSFNNLDISGLVRLNGQSLDIYLTTRYVTVSAANISFNSINEKILDVSTNINTSFNSYTTGDLSISLRDINNKINEVSSNIRSISNNVYTRTFIDNCLNVNYVKTSTPASTQFKIYDDKFVFDSSGVYTQTTATTYNTVVIAEWKTNYLTVNRPVIQFYSNGDIANLTGNYGGWSDIRLKENIIDTGPKLQDLLKVRIVNYNLKENNSEKLIGVIAQELEEIFPSLVTEIEPSQEDIKAGRTIKYKTVKYSCFTVMLIKALQEEQEIINKLDTRILALDEEYNIYKDLQESTKALKNDLICLKQDNIILKSKLNEILSELGKNIIP